MELLKLDIKELIEIKRFIHQLIRLKILTWEHHNMINTAIFCKYNEKEVRTRDLNSLYTLLVKLNFIRELGKDTIEFNYLKSWG